MSALLQPNLVVMVEFNTQFLQFQKIVQLVRAHAYTRKTFIGYEGFPAYPLSFL
jgi:hypothetical protein